MVITQFLYKVNCPDINTNSHSHNSNADEEFMIKLILPDNGFHLSVPVCAHAPLSKVV